MSPSRLHRSCTITILCLVWVGSLGHARAQRGDTAGVAPRASDGPDDAPEAREPETSAETDDSTGDDHERTRDPDPAADASRAPEYGDSDDDPGPRTSRPPTIHPPLSLAGALPTAPEWHWVQVLAAPRIGQQLTSIAVSPRRPDRIFVGSQSGQVLRSEDAGTTWTELEPDAASFPGRTVPAPRPSTRCRECGDEVVFRQRLPYRPFTFRLLALFPADIRPWFDMFEPTTGIFGLPNISDPTVTRTLLGRAVTRRPTDPVLKIQLCPGTEYPLVIAARREVLGSPDGGYTWVRLLRFPGNVTTPQIACHAGDTNRLVVATNAGMWESTDGGITLDPDLSGWPRRAVQAVEFAEDGTLYLSSREELFVREAPGRDPHRVYPDFDVSETIPWENINWITTDGREVWLATQDGVRHSIDWGQHFTNVAPNLLSRQAIGQIIVGEGETGVHRVAAVVRDCPTVAPGESTRGTGQPRRDPIVDGCRTTHLLSSDDGGDTWHPFFSGITRRNIQQVAYSGGRWWVLTGGELWVTARAESGSMSTEVIEAAQTRLATTPPMGVVIETALDRADLSRSGVNALLDRARDRNWIPNRISLNFELDIPERDLRQIDAPPSGPSAGLFQDTIQRTSSSSWSLFLFATWELEDTVSYAPEELTYARTHLYQLRERISFMIEDAWHERRMHLRRLARGFADPYQAGVLLERVEVLETVMEFWLDGELEALAPELLTRRRR